MANGEHKESCINTKKKIMIIDDENDFLEITKLNLEQTNKYEVMALSQAKEIISQLHTFEPNLILLDILMPGIDGLKACEVLNEDPLGRITPIIILSALDKSQDKLKAYKLGVVDYITKPVDKNKLISKIEKALCSKKP